MRQKRRTLRVVLTILRRSTQRMPPVQRAKFLEAAMQPALEATKRAAAWGASAPEANGTRSADCQRDSSSDSDEQDSLLGLCGDAHGGQSQLQLPPTDQEVPPRAAYEAAASAAMAAIDFAAPLLVQARAERVSAFSAAATTVVEGHYAREEAPERTGSGATARKATAMAAADVSLAAYIGFALSALELAAETSPCATAATAGPTLGLEHSASAETLARAEETLVGLVIGGPAVDLQFVLFHGCRLSYAGRIKRRNGGQEGEREQWKGASSNCGGLARLGELAVTGAMPWGLRGVSTLAYLVRRATACAAGVTVVEVRPDGGELSCRFAIQTIARAARAVNYDTCTLAVMQVRPSVVYVGFVRGIGGYCKISVPPPHATSQRPKYLQLDDVLHSTASGLYIAPRHLPQMMRS